MSGVTGEHLAVGEKSRLTLPLVWVVPAIAIVAGFGASAWAIKAQAAEVQRLGTAERDIDRRVQRLEDNYKFVREGIGEIKADLKAIRGSR